MHCPSCQASGTRVIDSRDLENGSTIRRRRECETCGHRFTTYERPEGARLTRHQARRHPREDFDRAKVLAGLMKACEKRPVTLARLEQAADDIEAQVCEPVATAEVTSKEVGKLATDALRGIDQLAYIRFASVYHSYEDISTLKREVDRLIKQRSPVE